MTTLIQVGNSQGIVGRCDAKCYDATHDKCDCVCGGKNHGAGKKQAVHNTREYAKEMIKKYSDEKGLKDFEALIGVDVVQGNLL